MSAPTYVTVAGTVRQLARPLLTFPPELEPYINWDAVMGLRRALACDVQVETLPDRSVQILFFWPADVDPTDICSECHQTTEHAPTCSYHERCPHCGKDAAERIGETATGGAIRFCPECGIEWEHGLEAL